MTTNFPELVTLYTYVTRLIAEKEDVVGEHTIEQSLMSKAFGHNLVGSTHIFYINVEVLSRVENGEEKPIEYPHINYLVTDLEIDTTNAEQVVKYVAVHEAAHMLEHEFGGYAPSRHKEDFETILIDLLDKYWSVL